MMQLRGVSSMVAKLKAIQKQFPDRLKQAMMLEAQIEVTEMKRRCPVDTRPNAQYPYQRAPHPGNLRNSIHAELVERGKHTVIIFATGKQAPYAVYVHENPDAFHPIGQWKFMESVMKESAPYMAERIGRRVHFDTFKV